MLEQKLYTVADVAEITGLTSRTIRNYLKDGTLHGRKIGVQWRFTEDDINGLFQEADFSQKLTKAEDNLVADFLKEGIREKEMICLIFDIPDIREEVWNTKLKEIRQMINRERDIQFAWQYENISRMLRIVMVGEPKKAKDMLDKVKRGLGTDAE